MATTVAPTTTIRTTRRKILQGWIQPIAVQIVLVLAGVSFLVPFLWMLSTSLKVDTQIFI